MLYVIHKRNLELRYQDGQDGIIHLVSCIGIAIESSGRRPWAFSDGNAGARYTRFSNDLAQFDEFVDKKAIQATSWSDPAVKERKQAEFLVYQSFPWTGFIAVGAISAKIAVEAQHHLAGQEYRPNVFVKPEWYY